MGLFGTSGDSMGQSLGCTWVYLGPLRSYWVNLGLLGSTWVYLGLLGSTWVYLGLSGSPWVCVGHFRTLKPISGLDGLDWKSPGGRRYRAPYGANKACFYLKIHF